MTTQPCHSTLSHRAANATMVDARAAKAGWGVAGAQVAVLALRSIVIPVGKKPTWPGGLNRETLKGWER